MIPPVRMVCGDCLRSVDIALDPRGSLPPLATCPFCGGTIESRLSEMGTRTDDFPGALGADAIPEGSKLWSETWIKGSLGVIGRYQIREMLGDGGFGQVYLAYDPRLDRNLAVKVLKQSDPGERVMQRFFREARAAARLEHPNIVAVHDAGCDDGRCWIAYEFVRGRTLLRQNDQKPIDQARAVAIIRDLADAVDHAHRQGIYHRDLKPSNILIDDAGRPHLTDFGLARRADFDSDLTRDGAILGTPAYMSPEQASGRSHLADERSDVYSLGVILHELLCGRRPSNLPSQVPAWAATRVEPPPSPPALDHSIPRPLARICLKALALDPAGRYPDAGALRVDLDRWIQRQNAPTGLSHPLACVLMGIAAALLLIVGLKAALAPTPFGRPPVADGRPIAAVAPIVPEAPVARTDTDGAGLQAVTSAPKTVESAPRNDLPPTANPTEKPLVGNRSTKKYHTRDCKSIGSMNSSNSVLFDSAEEAISQQFRPCDKCHPPTARSGDTPGEDDPAQD